jgi:methyl-accepting chemotaxis protein
MVGSFFFTAIFSLLSANTLTISYKDYNLLIGKTPVILIKEILSAHWMFIVPGGIFVVIAAMFLTHRFAGPIFRFEKTLEEMIQGNFSIQIRLRTKDEAQELADMLNQFNSVFSSRLREMSQLNELVSGHLAAMAGSRVNADAAEELDKAIAANIKLKEVFQGFKLKNDD